MLARQKERALGSITEVVQTVKYPKSITQDTGHDTVPKHEEQEKLNSDFVLPTSAAIESTSIPGMQTPQRDFQGDNISRLSSCEHGNKKIRKSACISLIG